ncbi:glycosyltransferase family 2 protein [Arenibaculum pallidiluteum]|uniref:glycosyltransferase family 2 protein n=1 Tax=Arenibaculum pallidiluteum TaxID=2812559 RepID=UPI001A970F06|nr:glycosyltransferase [Arenibaculum pallidiluteum]
MISVIMPAFQAEEFIGAAIESIRNQSLRDWELIVSDDGSTDGTLAIAERHAAEDSRIRVLRNDHVGVAANGNRCLEAARFPWVARMDADDVALEHRLARLMQAALESPEVVLWGGRAILIDRNGRHMRDVNLGPRSTEEFRAMRAEGKVIYVCGPTSMMRRDVALRAGGYDPGLKASVDVELMDRMADFGEVRTIPDVLTLYRLHGGSISSARVLEQQRTFSFVRARNLARLEGRMLTYPEYLQELDSQPWSRRALRRLRAHGQRYYRNGLVHLAERRFAAATGALGLALIFDPTNTLKRAGRRVGGNVKRRLVSA